MHVYLFVYTNRSGQVPKPMSNEFKGQTSAPMVATEGEVDLLWAKKYSTWRVNPKPKESGRTTSWTIGDTSNRLLLANSFSVRPLAFGKAHHAERLEDVGRSEIASWVNNMSFVGKAA